MNTSLPGSFIANESFSSLTNQSISFDPATLHLAPTSNWLPETKFSPPTSSDTLIQRPTCLASLAQSIQTKRLTLLTAPAGYGKSSLLASYFFQMKDASNPDAPAADVKLSKAQATNAQASFCWLSLDEYDNDLMLFWLALGKALHFTESQVALTPTVQPNQVGQSITTDSARRIHSLVGTLINAILARSSRPLILLLDDCHRVHEANIYRLLDTLLERLPPQVHIVMACRCAPPLALARLSSRGQLAEYRTTQLAFTADETTSFLNDHFGLALSPTALTLAYNYTEGWATGLHFLATALTGVPLATERAARLAHFVANACALATQSYIHEYLAAELLNPLPPILRLFMLQSAILNELTPAHCQTITANPGAATLLEELFRQNLFITPVQNINQPKAGITSTMCYRYHPIFANFLRYRLAVELPELVQTLYQRASTLDLQPEEKLAHAIQAQAWPVATMILVEAGTTLLQQGPPNLFLQWLNQLPPAVVAETPILLYLQGVCQWQQGNGPVADQLLTRALAQFSAKHDDTACGQTLIYLAASSVLCADTAGALARLEHAAHYPLSSNAQFHSELTHLWLSLSAQVPNWQQAEQRLAEVLNRVDNQDRREQLRALHLSSSCIWLLMERTCAPLLMRCQWAITQHLPPDCWWQLYLDNLLAWNSWLNGTLNQAQRHLDHGMALAQQLAPTRHPIQAELTLLQSCLELLQQNFSSAQQRLQEILTPGCATEFAPTQWLFCQYLLGRAYWEAGQLIETRQIYQEINNNSNPIIAAHRQIYTLMLGGLLEMSAGSYVKASDLLHEAVVLEQQFRSATLLHTPRLLLAYLYLQWKGSGQALTIFTPLLTQCQRQNRPALLYQGGRMTLSLLQAAVRQRATAPLALDLLSQLERLMAIPKPHLPDTGAQLSRRELVVLQLLVGGASNRLIAERLDITLPTVKSHVTNLLQKLNVTRRQDAVLRAQELGLS